MKNRRAHKLNFKSRRRRRLRKQFLQPAPAPGAAPTGGSAVVIDVDGSKLTQSQVETEIKRIMPAMKKQMPAGRLDQAKANARRQVLSDFTVKTLLTNEMKRLNISASDAEVKEAEEQVKNDLPKGMTIEDLMKKNKISKRRDAGRSAVQDKDRQARYDADVG